MQAQLVQTANLHSAAVYQHSASTQQVALQQERTEQRNRGKGGTMGLPGTLGAPKWAQLGAADDIYADTQQYMLSCKVTHGFIPDLCYWHPATDRHNNFLSNLWASELLLVPKGCCSSLLKDKWGSRTHALAVQ